MSLRPDLNPNHHDAFGQASARREPAARVAHAHPQDPRVTATSVGAGDRAVADARRALLDPLGLSTPKDQQKPTPAQASLPNWSALNDAFTITRSMQQQAEAARQAKAQQEAQRVSQLGRIAGRVRSQAQREADRAAHPEWFLDHANGTE